MFNFSKKERSLNSVGNGKVIRLDEIKDQVFSQKILGDGFALIPENGEVFSPVKGKVTSISDTFHAYCITSDDGLEVLVHIGIDTVELKGKGFESHVVKDQKVGKGTLLAFVDLNLLKKHGYDTSFIVIVTNIDKLKKFNVQETVDATKETPAFIYTV